MRTIAEVLHRAADEFLWNGIREPGGNLREYSCGSAYASCGPSYYKKIKPGLAAMGLDTDSYTEFDELPEGPKRQGARYAWLKFAAMIAEEQGV
jgi:hypothetical protein